MWRAWQPRLQRDLLVHAMNRTTLHRYGSTIICREWIPVCDQTKCGRNLVQHTTTCDELMSGAALYVLEPELQDGKRIPKWFPRARLGMFVGLSLVHSSLVPLVLNVKMGKISPQYHVVFDDKFSTVNSLSSEDSIDKTMF